MNRYSLLSRFLLVLWAASCALLPAGPLPASVQRATGQPDSLLPLASSAAPLADATFDVTDDTLRLETPYYALVFRKADGSFFFIADKSAGQHVTEGSRGLCLWWAVSRSGTNASGCP